MSCHECEGMAEVMPEVLRRLDGWSQDMRDTPQFAAASKSEKVSIGKVFAKIIDAAILRERDKLAGTPPA